MVKPRASISRHSVLGEDAADFLGEEVDYRGRGPWVLEGCARLRRRSSGTEVAEQNLLLDETQHPERELRNVSHHRKRHDGARNEGHKPRVDARKRRLEYRLPNEDVDAEGRGESADAQVHDHDHAEVDRVDASGLGHGGEERGEDEDGGGGVEDHADQEEKDVHREEEGPGGEVEVGDPGDDRRADAAHGEEPGVDASAGEDDEDLRGEVHGARGGVEDISRGSGFNHKKCMGHLLFLRVLREESSQEDHDFNRLVIWHGPCIERFRENQHESTQSTIASSFPQRSYGLAGFAASD
jgi:hypothetical protein